MRQWRLQGRGVPFWSAQGSPHGVGRCRRPSWTCTAGWEEGSLRCSFVLWSRDAPNVVRWWGAVDPEPRQQGGLEGVRPQELLRARRYAPYPALRQPAGEVVRGCDTLGCRRASCVVDALPSTLAAPYCLPLCSVHNHASRLPALPVMLGLCAVRLCRWACAATG